jgi:hypothetical protein
VRRREARKAAVEGNMVETRKVEGKRIRGDSEIGRRAGLLWRAGSVRSMTAVRAFGAGIGK